MSLLRLGTWVCKFFIGAKNIFMTLNLNTFPIFGTNAREEGSM